MEKDLVLTFNTENNKTYRLVINQPKEELSKDVILPVAEKIIATKIFDTAKHKLISLKKVSYVSREETTLQ